MQHKKLVTKQSEDGFAEGGPEAGVGGLLGWFRRNKVSLQLLAYGIDRARQTVAAVRVKARGAPRNKGGKIGGRRGKIGGYTPASRARFREAILAVEPVLKPRRRGNRWHHPASFLTLTYPASWDPDPREWKRHLDRWLQKLKRRYPEAWAIWALEFQTREAPHFHLIVYWGGSRPKEPWKERQQWISSSWAAIVGHGEPQPAHLGAGTQVRPLESAAKVRNYITKRQTKDSVPEGFGALVGDTQPKGVQGRSGAGQGAGAPGTDRGGRRRNSKNLAQVYETWRGCRDLQAAVVDLRACRERRVAYGWGLDRRVRCGLDRPPVRRGRGG